MKSVPQRTGTVSINEKFILNDRFPPCHPAINKIREKLRKHPYVPFTFKETFLTLKPKGLQSFPVGLEVNGNSFVVSALGWHDSFSSEDEALNCFAFLLSESARLEVHSRGDFQYKWILESQQNDEWKADSEVGVFWRPFWGKKKVVKLQNHLISIN